LKGIKLSGESAEKVIQNITFEPPELRSCQMESQRKKIVVTWRDFFSVPPFSAEALGGGCLNRSKFVGSFLLSSQFFE